MGPGKKEELRLATTGRQSSEDDVDVGSDMAPGKPPGVSGRGKGVDAGEATRADAR